MAEPETSMDPNRMNPYGPGANADETRQAQHQQTNDTPTDVNMNAVVAREQASTLVLMGKNFEAGAARRNALFDHAAALMGMASTPAPTAK